MELVPPAQAIFLTGFMGTGKTTNGRRLAERLGLPFIDTDDVVEQQTGRTIREIFESEGEQRFRDLETQALRQVLAGQRAVVSTGGGIMLRPVNVALMKEAGPVLCLTARPETIYQRTSRQQDRPLLNTEDPLATIRSLLAEREPAYAQADRQFHSDRGSREELLAELLAALAEDPRCTLLLKPHVRVPVTAGEHEYTIHIAAGALDALGQLCPAPCRGVRCAVVTTEALVPLYSERVRRSLTEGGWDPKVLAVPDGEGSKTLEVAAGLYDQLVEAGVDSGGAVFALGGGVVGDLAGFVAATYRRGIRLAQVPTSLLAQVDACIGGKVAVDHPRGKNLIGTFYHPGAVVIDTQTLTTLPARELRAGLAEVVKHAAIADSLMFEYLEQHLDDFLRLDDVSVRYVLGRSCQIKARIVAADPYDRGGRAVLNFGHTVGHALERAADDWGLRHGEAVAVGMVAEARLGVTMGLTQEATVERLAALLRKAGLPTCAPQVNPDLAIAALHLDKKISAGKLRLPVLPDIGSVRVVSDVAPSALEEAVRLALKRCAQCTQCTDR